MFASWQSGSYLLFKLIKISDLASNSMGAVLKYKLAQVLNSNLISE